ncbi:MAG: hypothetical protein J0I20_11325 [Chloroflexi bacterium]|nr:hypothetical protein [Chloroflexota bacterium]OJV92335.1 MAG: hypothetical protein BGO39_30845 [Chloroflexi bacterium 54-19]
MTRVYRVRLRAGLLWLVLALIAVLGFVLFSLFRTDAGFPLDDGWIHQVFARNLAELGEFSYNPGQPVAGSTSPLWTLLLVPGYWLPGFHMAWTYTLGLLFLALTAGESFRLGALFSRRQSVAVAAALFTLFDWRLVWAGASGMETLLFTYGTLLLTRIYLTRYPTNVTLRTAKPAVGRVPVPLILGLVGGFLTLVRPEGMVLLGLAALDTGWRNRRDFQTLLKFWGWLLLGWVLPVAPYFIFNYALSGSLLPTTFGAKVSGYADLSPGGILNFLWAAFFQIFLAGPVIFLVPGLLFCIPFLRAKKLDGRALVWPLVLLVLYAARLPVTYQHARYLMPVIPFLAIYGAVGGREFLEALKKFKLPRMAFFAPWILALVYTLWWGLGAVSYQFDVKLINDEQVRVAEWLNQNTPETATVATHDIGAIGYFSGRTVVDTAGLVSPEFVPIVRDQAAILAKLEAMKVNYFAMLPNWYPDLYTQLSAKQAPVFQPQETYLAQFGEKNMAVFKLN